MSFLNKHEITDSIPKRTDCLLENSNDIHSVEAEYVNDNRKRELVVALEDFHRDEQRDVQKQGEMLKNIPENPTVLAQDDARKERFKHKESREA